MGAAGSVALAALRVFFWEALTLALVEGDKEGDGDGAGGGGTGQELKIIPSWRRIVSL